MPKNYDNPFFYPNPLDELNAGINFALSSDFSPFLNPTTADSDLFAYPSLDDITSTAVEELREDELERVTAVNTALNETTEYPIIGNNIKGRVIHKRPPTPKRDTSPKEDRLIHFDESPEVRTYEIDSGFQHQKRYKTNHYEQLLAEHGSEEKLYELIKEQHPESLKNHTPPALYDDADRKLASPQEPTPFTWSERIAGEEKKPLRSALKGSRAAALLEERKQRLAADANPCVAL